MIGEDWSLLFPFMKKSKCVQEGLLDNAHWEPVIHAGSIPPEWPRGLASFQQSVHSQRWHFMEGCQQTCEVVLFLWIHLSVYQVNNHIDLIHHDIHESALQFDGSTSLQKVMCWYELCNLTVLCYVTVWKRWFKHTDSIILQSIFSLGEKSRLDFPVLLSVLSTIIYKQDGVILHEFPPVLNKAYDEILWGCIKMYLWPDLLLIGIKTVCIIFVGLCCFIPLEHLAFCYSDYPKHRHC